MPSLGRTFTVDEGKAKDTGDTLPKGTYRVLIESAEVKPGYQGDGEVLALKLQVVDGPCKGRKLFSDLTLTNSDMTRIDRDEAKIHQLGIVARVATLETTEQLVGKVCQASVATYTRETGMKAGSLANAVNSFKPDAATPQPEAPAAVPAPVESLPSEIPF